MRILQTRDIRGSSRELGTENTVGLSDRQDGGFMSLPTEIAIFKLAAERLDENGIPYMLSGSVAGNFYGYPRMTRDIDIVIEIGEERAAQLVELFKDDFYIDADMVYEAIRDEGMFNIIHLKDIIKIDFIVRKSTPYRILEFHRRICRQIGDFRFWIVSPEDLILSKLLWARDSHSEMQLRDAANIIQSIGGKIDQEYLKRWATELGVADLLGGINHE